MSRGKRIAKINMSGEEFRKLGYELTDKIAKLLDEIDKKKVTSGLSPVKIRELLNTDIALKDSGSKSEEIIDRAAALLLEHSLFNGHPRFWGYITSSPAPLGILADYMASAINPNVGGWTLSPVATEMEVQTIKWIGELINYKADGGILVSGGNMANFVGFLAGTRAKLGQDIRRFGLAGRTPKIYCSAETHTWIQKAADLFGFGTDATVWIPTNENQQMNADELQKRIEKDKKHGSEPIMVIGTAGSVSTGAIDPLYEIGAICREHNLWYHIDGAYGGFAACLPERFPELEAFQDADSIAVDPHKWLYAPLEAGCTLVKYAHTLPDTFSYHPPYYHFGVEAVNFVDNGFQNSRGFRALKVWMMLQQVGSGGYKEMIAEDCDLAKHLYEILPRYKELERFTYNLSITTFRYIPEELRKKAKEESTSKYLDDLNKNIQAKLESGGDFFVSNAVINGIYVLRMCIVNFRTSKFDVEALPERVIELGRELH
jgi:glutamate/tyrosine decarboxylase-like PLP-dependent enzyme